MMKNLAAVAGGGALALALVGAVSPAAAWGSVRPAALTHNKLANQAAPPTIRDSRVWTAGAVRTMLTAPPDTPTVRAVTARNSDPDDGGQ